MIEIGQKTFKTKKEAEAFIQSVLYKYPPNNALEGDDLAFVCDLLALHPDKDKKIGIGIKSIIIEKETAFNRTSHFSVIRMDGSKEDFSFKKCLTPSLNEPLKMFRSSARRTIADQVVFFRDDFFLKNQDINGRVRCAITGVSINKNTSHVDHIPPDTFSKITSDFISVNKIDFSSIKFIESADGIGRLFKDDDLNSLFSSYHKKVAKLRIVSVLANLRQKKN